MTIESQASFGPQDVRKIVLDIISHIAPDEEISDVKDDLSLRDQLDLDSMDFLDIVMELRRRHKVEVPPQDYPQLASLQSCMDYLTPKFNPQAPQHTHESTQSQAL
jgi:acyl carrier protein